ncbi:MAG: arsenate reductase ArsC [Pseudomonadota bacterium]
MPANVLFLCTGNSARSILAEVLLNARSIAGVTAYSAGSQPVGAVNPGAIEVLSKHGHEVADLRSKSWDEFAGASAPSVDFVVTVCNNAAGEQCPIWNGSPMVEHWGLPDPAAVDDDAERRQAFATTYDDLLSRVDDFMTRHHLG